jgi:tRNA modification GTPase
MSHDTIFALASAPGRGGVAVIRLSGPRAASALQALTGKPCPAPRLASRAHFIDPQSQDLLDDGLALWFPGPASFTGEDVVELQGHGGRAVTDSLLQALAQLPGLRPAEAGEFSRRAFHNGKLDLTQAEAIADLVDAETSAQQRQALRQMGGALARLYDGWRTDLVRSLAHLEAYIDFPDEDLPPEVDQGARDGIDALRHAMADHLADGHRGERLRDGLSVAIVGAPNAGKSSLVNALARRDAAIVSATAGTTRDVVEVHLDLGGYPVVLADTAGLRDATEDIEAEGIRRAHARAQDADLKVAVFDGTAWPNLDTHTVNLVDDSTVVVINKGDQFDAHALQNAAATGAALVKGQVPLVVSVKSGAGMSAFLDHLEEAVKSRLESHGAAPALTRARHRAAIEDCAACLGRSLQAPALELMAEDLRLAARALGRITGRVDVEDLLDVIFRDFCIGK